MFDLILKIVLYLLSVVIFLVFMARRNSDFLTMIDVIKNHLSIFKNDKAQYILFYIMPILLAIALVLTELVSEDLISSIVLVLSILLTMLFTLMGTLVNANYKSITAVKPLVKETIDTLLYEALACLIELLFCLVVLFIGNYEVCVILIVGSFIIYWLMIHIVLNIFLIVQRIGVVLSFLSK